MAFDPSSDLRSILASVGDPVTLPGGGMVYAHTSVATLEDAVDGDSVVAGRTRVLRFAAADVPALAHGQTLTWSARPWRVVKLQLGGMGTFIRAFLGAP